MVSKFVSILTLIFYLSLDHYGQSFWLGLNDIDNEGTYVWQGSGEIFTESSYDHFNPGQPSGGGEDCVEMRRAYGYYWNDLNCNTNYPYICETSRYTYVSLCIL